MFASALYMKNVFLDKGIFEKKLNSLDGGVVHKIWCPGSVFIPQDCKRKSSNRAEGEVGPWKSFISKFYKKTSNTQKAKKVWAFCMHTFICDENWKRTVLFFRCRRRRPARLSCSDEKRRKLFPFPRFIFFPSLVAFLQTSAKHSQR